MGLLESGQKNCNSGYACNGEPQTNLEKEGGSCFCGEKGEGGAVLKESPLGRVTVQGGNAFSLAELLRGGREIFLQEENSVPWDPRCRRLSLPVQCIDDR